MKGKERNEASRTYFFFTSALLKMAMIRHRSFSLYYFCLSIFAAFLLIFVNCDDNLNGLSSTPINRDLYHSSWNHKLGGCNSMIIKGHELEINPLGKVDDLMDMIKNLVHRHPDKLSMETIEAGNKGYNAEIAVVTYCHRGQDCDDRSKIRVLLSFGQHGRELITTELALRILSILSEEQFLPNMNPVYLNSTLDELVIKVVPMENLNGRKLVEEGDLCERRNGRGVDLNRNWSVDWGKKEKDYDPYEENPGTAPFSEPESQIMRKLALSFDPHIWVNVHSGMEALFMPYDHKNTTPDGLPSQRMRRLLEQLNKVHCQKRCMIGSGGGSVGYLAHGTATDYMFDVVRVPMSFTFEIYGDGATSSKDCFKMFNPIDHSNFNRVLNDWSATFFTIFKFGPRYLDEFQAKASAANGDKWVSIDEYLDGYLMQRTQRDGKKMEVLDLGMQEIRTYFRLFLLSSVLLLFMFCSRISKSKYSRPTTPL